MIVAVLVTSQNAEEALAEHREQGLPALRLGIGQTLGHALGKVPTPVKLPDRQQPGIGSQLTYRELDNHRHLWEKIKGDLVVSFAGVRLRQRWLDVLQNT